MVIQTKRYVIILLLGFIFSFHTYSQNTENKQLLSEIIVALEQRFNIQFNYAEDVIKNIKIETPPENLVLEDALLYLETETNLSFRLTDNNMVLVLRVSPFDLQKLSEVMVSGFIVKGINKLHNGSFEINTSEFDILPGLVNTDVLQAVQAFPGIQSINETVSNINIRGGSHDQNLILWDDIKMYQSGHFFGLISMFNPQITERVSLIKNGSSTEFTDGVSGTIAMETDRSINDSFKGNLGVNFIDANGFVDVPTGKKSSLQLAARKSISDFTETPTYNNFFERISQDTEVETNEMSIINSDKTFDFYDISLRWNYRINDKEQLRVNFINVANELIFNENVRIDNFDDTRQSSLTQNSIAGAVAYSRIWNTNWQTTLEIYETDYKLKSINANVIEEQRFLQENKISETSVKLKVNHTINERLKWLNGYHFVETKITNLDDVDTPRFKNLISEVVRTHGVFSQIAYNSEDKNTYIIGGLRYNFIDKFKKHLLEPRLSVSRKFFNHFSIEVLGELKHQNTSQIINFQNDFLGIEKRRWQLSNDDDIPVIQSRQLSIGLSYSNNGWLVSSEGYYKKIKGITTQSQGFQNQYEFTRTDGFSEAIGLDVIVRKQLNHFNSWLSYSFLNANYEFNGLAEKRFPSNFDVTHALTFGTNYSSEHFKISIGLNWNSGRPTTRPVEGNEILDSKINFDDTNTSTLKNYFRVDASALYDFTFGKNTKTSLGLSIWNLLDRENIINSFYRVSGDEEAVEVKQRSLGLTPNLVFRVNF